MRKMRSREIVLPRNVPAENFPSAWSVSSEKKYSCSVLGICIYSLVLVLVLGIISMLVFIGIRGSFSPSKVALEIGANMTKVRCIFMLMRGVDQFPSQT